MYDWQSQVECGGLENHLPRNGYKGSNPLSYALLNNESQTCKYSQ